MRHIPADFLHAPRDFVPERHRQIGDPGNAGAVMRVRMTDSGSSNANQNLGRANLRNWNVGLL